MPKSTLTGGRWVTIEHEHVYVKGSAIVAGHVPTDKKSVEKAVKDGGASRMFKPDDEVRETSTSFSALAKANEAYSKQSSELKDNQSLTKKHLNAIEQYKSGDYVGISNAMIAGTASPSGTPKEINAFYLQQATTHSSPTSKDVVLYRHFGYDPKHAIGETVTTKGFTSTSTLSNTNFMSQREGLSYGYEIAVPKGSRGILGGFNQGEHEMLLPNGANLQVLGKKELRYQAGLKTQTRTIYQLAYLGPGEK